METLINNKHSYFYDMLTMTIEEIGNNVIEFRINRKSLPPKIITVLKYSMEWKEMVSRVKNCLSGYGRILFELQPNGKVIETFKFEKDITQEDIENQRNFIKLEKINHI